MQFSLHNPAPPSAPGKPVVVGGVTFDVPGEYTPDFSNATVNIDGEAHALIVRFGYARSVTGSEKAIPFFEPFPNGCLDVQARGSSGAPIITRYANRDKFNARTYDGSSSTSIRYVAWGY